MKKMNKKGFTIVELVIVIAVIAILSAVMIPTFSGATRKAKESAATQNANKAYQAVITALNYAEDETLDLNTDDGPANGVDAYIKAGDYYVSVKNGELSEPTKEAPAVELVKENIGNDTSKTYYQKAAAVFGFTEEEDPEAFAAEVYVYVGQGVAPGEGD